MREAKEAFVETLGDILYEKGINSTQFTSKTGISYRRIVETPTSRKSAIPIPRINDIEIIVEKLELTDSQRDDLMGKFDTLRELKAIEERKEQIYLRVPNLIRESTDAELREYLDILNETLHHETSRRKWIFRGVFALIGAVLSVIFTAYLYISASLQGALPVEVISNLMVAILLLGVYVYLMLVLRSSRNIDDLIRKIDRVERELDVRDTLSSTLLGEISSTPQATKQTTTAQGTSDIDPNKTYFDRLVRLNINNLTDYYSEVKDQAQKSYKTTRWIAIAGFALIFAGLAIGFFFPERLSIASIATGSGLLVEFIAGVFFYLYNQTIRQMKDYHDTLIDVQNVLLAFKMVSDTDKDTTEQQSQMMGQIMMYLTTKSSKAGANLPTPGMPTQEIETAG